jgi:photosystem II stability/assembly factor-like uncharacterized protein
MCRTSQRGRSSWPLLLGLLALLSCSAPAVTVWLPAFVPQGAEPSALACPSPQSCLAVGQGGLVLVSQNSGLSWIPANTGLGASLVNFNLTSVACLSATQCTIVGNQGLILSSSNGGQSFSIQNVTTNGNLTFNDVVCQSSGTPACAIVGDNNTLLLLSSPTSAWSPDLSVLQAPIGPANFDQVFLLGSSIWITASTTSGTGMNALLHSGDGGNTWALEIVPQSLAPQGVSGVGCPGSSNCFVDGTGAILETTDGGRSWSSVLLGNSGSAQTLPSLTGIYIGPEGTVFAFGNQGSLYQVSTLSGGSVSGQVAVPQLLPSGASQLNLGGMTCSAASTCYLAGYSLAISGGIFYSSPNSPPG